MIILPPVDSPQQEGQSVLQTSLAPIPTQETIPNTFLLELTSKDPVHRKACRKAAWAYVNQIRVMEEFPQIPPGEHSSPTWHNPTQDHLQTAKELEALLVKTMEHIE